MSEGHLDETQRWTAKRRAALVLRILRGETSPPPAPRSHGLTLADVSFHSNDPNNPHAHVMLTMREVTPEGFGPKNRDWNRRERLRSGAWRPKDSLNLSHYEVMAGGPVTRGWLAAEASGRPPALQESYHATIKQMDHAKELVDYKRSLAKGAVKRNPDLDAELKEIGQQAQKEIHPERAVKRVAEKLLRPRIRVRTREDALYELLGSRPEDIGD